MTTVQNKRKAEEELKKSDPKKKPGTPRQPTSRRVNQSPVTMAESSHNPERSLADEMKRFIAEAGEASDRRVQSLFEKVNTKVEKNSSEIELIKKSIERIEAKQNENETRVTHRSGPPSPRSHQAEKYSFARRSLRLWPIPGSSDEEVRYGTIRFLCLKLLACENECPDSSIQRTRRTRQPRKTSVNNEVLVTFTDRFVRDYVASNGRNLGEYRNQDGVATAGMRMNYPDHLGPDFRALEWYGARMREMHGPGLKRNIRFDDDVLGLCIDIKMPHLEEWLRVTPDMAKEYKSKQITPQANQARRLLETPPTTASRPLSQLPATGANCTPLPAPVLPGRVFTQRAGSPQTVTHDPNEVIYISPRKRGN